MVKLKTHRWKVIITLVKYIFRDCDLHVVQSRYKGHKFNVSLVANTNPARFRLFRSNNQKLLGSVKSQDREKLYQNIIF